MTTPILAYPNFKQIFIVATDTSYSGYEATLSQIDITRKEHLIAYVSKSLQPEEVNYRATKLEYAAIVWAIEYFYKYLGTSKFILITNHIALKWLQTTEPKGKIGRWILKLQLYNLKLFINQAEFTRI